MTIAIKLESSEWIVKFRILGTIGQILFSPYLRIYADLIPLYIVLPFKEGFPGGSDGKEPTCQCERLALVPGSLRSPGEGNDYLLHYSGLENPMDRGAFADINPLYFVLPFKEPPNITLRCQHGSIFFSPQNLSKVT